MTVTEALQAGKQFYSMRDESDVVEHICTVNNVGSMIKHLFRVTMLQRGDNQYFIFTNENFVAYDWATEEKIKHLMIGVKIKHLMIGVKKEKKTVWINIWKGPLSGEITAGRPKNSKDEALLAQVCQTEHFIGVFPIEIEI